MGDHRHAAERAVEEALAEFTRIESSGDWEDIGESDEVKRYKKREGDRILVKGQGIINFTPDDVAEFLMNISNRHKYLADLDFVHLLDDYQDLKVIHEALKLPWPLSNRDVTFASKRINNGEDALVVSKSVDIGVPVPENYVRGEMIVHGYRLKNIEDIATEMTFIVCADPKGNIPVMVINQMAGVQALAVSRIKNAMNEG